MCKIFIDQEFEQVFTFKVSKDIAFDVDIPGLTNFENLESSNKELGKGWFIINENDKSLILKKDHKTI